MRYILSFSLLVFLGCNTWSQYYTRDAGIRAGEGVFLSYRQFFDEERAIEGFAGFSRDGFKLMALREHCTPVALAYTENLRLLYGYGVHLGIDYTNNYKVFNQVYYHDWMWNPKFGVDGLIGLEYAAPDLPFIVSAGLQPYFEFSLNQYYRLYPFNFVVSFKYRF